MVASVGALAKGEAKDVNFPSVEPSYYRSRSHLLLCNIRWFFSSMIGALEFTT